jgi:peptidyl-prolyl cis-trans isomerase D
MFAVLIGAFALSMGGTNYFDRVSRPTVAKVGSVQITPQQYQHAYQRTVENLSSRAHRRLTPQEAKALGLPERVLQNLIQEAAVDSEAHALGLGLSKEGLKDSIYRNEYFHDASGKFDPQKYQQFLTQIGYSAAYFEQELSADLVRRQLRGIFEKSAIVPKVLLDALNRYENAQRVISYFNINDATVGAIEPASEEFLHTFYNERKRQFMAPEMRKVAVVAINPQTVASRITIADADSQATYDANPETYHVPERRKLELIPFQSKQAADEAAAALNRGKDFVAVAKEAGFKQPEIDLGTLSKKEFGNKFAANDKMIEVAFSLKKGKVSEPVEGPLSTVIIRVLEIIPGQAKSFAEVKDRIREDLVKSRTAEETTKLTKAFEDERSAGVPVVEAAKKLNLPLIEAELDSGGKDSDGKPFAIAGTPFPALAPAAFKSDTGVENDALRLPGSGYAWFDVLDITKARQKPFEEVKAEVEAAWRKDQIRTKLSEKARELVARLDKGEAIAEVAKSVKAEAKTTPPLKRNGSEQGLPQTAVGQAFTLAEGAAGSVISGEGTSRAVFQVEKVIAPAPLDEAGAKALEEQIARHVADDNYAEYLIDITRRVGVSVDKKLAAEVAGGAVDNDY